MSMNVEGEKIHHAEIAPLFISVMNAWMSFSSSIAK